jgi:hypothetical protein
MRKKGGRAAARIFLVTPFLLRYRVVMRRWQNQQPQPPRPSKAQKPFFLPLVALYLVSVFVTLPFVNALHRRAEDLAQLEGCRQCAAPGSQRLPVNQRQHNEAQCITCQLIASSQRHALLLAASHELHLELSQLSVAASSPHIYSLDHTSAAVARGPPAIA